MEAERAEAFKKLLEHDAATKLDFLQAEQQRIDKTQELAGQHKKLLQDQAVLSEAETNYRALVSEFQQTKQAEFLSWKPRPRLWFRMSRKPDRRPIFND